MNRRHVWLACLVSCCALSSAAGATMGVMGDSLSDEYFEAPFGSYADNWVEQLVQYRSVNFGPTGSWGDPRRNGYKYNWARFGDNSAQLLSKGQHTGLAAQAASDGVQYGVLMIGANDLIYSGSNYSNIYNNAWSPAQIAAFRIDVVNNIVTALNTASASGIKMLLSTVPDYGVTPIAVQQRPSAANRQRVTDVITSINADLKSYAAAHNIPVLDLQAASLAIFGPNNALKTTLRIGNVNMNLRRVPIQPFLPIQATDAFVEDGIHITTPIQGILANLVVTGLNTRYGAGITPFSESEILAHRGIAYGGSDTLTGQIGPYSNFIIPNFPVPEPASLHLAWSAAVACAGLAYRRRAARR